MLIAINGWLASAEMALMTVKKNRLKALLRRGKKTAGVALELADNPTRLLSTIQIGITAIGLLNGIVGEAAFSSKLTLQLQKLGLQHELSHTLATVLVVVCITYFSIVIGELIPKRIAQNNAESIACLSARPLRMLAVFTKPFVWLLSRSTELALAWQKTAGGGNDLTYEDLQALLQQGGQDGLLAKQQQLWMDNVLHFDRRRASECMTPLNKLEYVDLTQSPQQQLETLLQCKHAYVPLCHAQPSNVSGLVSTKDYLAHLLQQHSKQQLEQLVLPAVYVPATLRGLKLLELLHDKQAHMLFVVDEYGQLTGIITWQNIVNALSGQLHAASARLRKLADGSYLLPASMPAAEVQNLLGFESLPGHADYQTLAGMLQSLLGSSGRVRAVCVHQGWQLRILAMHKNRITHVKATRLKD